MIFIKKQPSLDWEIPNYFQKLIPKWILYQGKQFSKKDWRDNTHTLENHILWELGTLASDLYLRED